MWASYPGWRKFLSTRLSARSSGKNVQVAVSENSPDKAIHIKLDVSRTIMFESVFPLHLERTLISSSWDNQVKREAILLKLHNFFGTHEDQEWEHLPKDSSPLSGATWKFNFWSTSQRVLMPAKDGEGGRGGEEGESAIPISSESKRLRCQSTSPLSEIVLIHPSHQRATIPYLLCIILESLLPWGIFCLSKVESPPLHASMERRGKNGHALKGTFQLLKLHNDHRQIREGP